MKLTLTYETTEKGIHVEQLLVIDDLEKDAKALGFMHHCICETSKVLALYISSVHPKLRLKILEGAMKSVMMKNLTKNPIYPFTSITDEAKTTDGDAATSGDSIRSTSE